MNIQSTKPTNASSYLSLFVNWCRIFAHIFYGVFTLIFVFPSSNNKNKQAHIHKWSLRLLTILGVQLKVINGVVLPNSPCLLISNHISWLDIHAINAFKPIRFVAKSEVENWPIFGWMAKQLGTVFIKRGNSRNAAQVVNHMAHILQSESICIFPEGTSTDGKTVLPFKSNLFESAHQAQIDVLPITIQYKENNEYSNRAAFIGDMELIDSIKNILKSNHLVVHIHLFDRLPSHLSRQELASQAHHLVASKT